MQHENYNSRDYVPPLSSSAAEAEPSVDEPAAGGKSGKKTMTVAEELEEERLRAVIHPRPAV